MSFEIHFKHDLLVDVYRVKFDFRVVKELAKDLTNKGLNEGVKKPLNYQII